jgi:hypothetical protein
VEWIYPSFFMRRLSRLRLPPTDNKLRDEERPTRGAIGSMGWALEGGSSSKRPLWIL